MGMKYLGTTYSHEKYKNTIIKDVCISLSDECGNAHRNNEMEAIPRDISICNQAPATKPHVMSVLNQERVSLHLAPRHFGPYEKRHSQ